MNINPKLKNFKRASKDDLIRDFLVDKEKKENTSKYGQKRYGLRK